MNLGKMELRNHPSNQSYHWPRQKWLNRDWLEDFVSGHPLVPLMERTDEINKYCLSIALPAKLYGRRSTSLNPGYLVAKHMCV